MKVVVNGCYGGFSISLECAELMESMGSVKAKEELDEYRKRLKQFDYRKKHGKWPKSVSKKEETYLQIEFDNGGKPRWYGYILRDDPVDRSDKHLVLAVSILGSERASGEHAELKIVEIPDDVEWYIAEYDGLEHVAEKHRTWR